MPKDPDASATPPAATTPGSFPTPLEFPLTHQPDSAALAQVLTGLGIRRRDLAVRATRPSGAAAVAKTDAALRTITSHAAALAGRGYAVTLTTYRCGCTATACVATKGPAGVARSLAGAIPAGHACPATALLDPAKVEARFKAALVGRDTAVASREVMGERAFSWSLSAMQRVIDSDDSLHAAGHVKLCAARLAGSHWSWSKPGDDTIAGWTECFSPLVAAANIAPPAERPLYRQLLADVVAAFRLQGVQWARANFGARPWQMAAPRIIPVAWGNRNRFYSSRLASGERTIQDAVLWRVAARVPAGTLARDIRNLIAELEATTPPAEPVIYGWHGEDFACGAESFGGGPAASIHAEQASSTEEGRTA
ncbi:hypothetical protein [Nonomuraea sp. NPDC049695]|uniref:hypothetical protein n=1 Tax=Nonomuraea sp. NPDC049695 TaxID=3154734 RepID=UPI003422E3C1